MTELETILALALDQLLDDMGEFGLCVCKAAKEQAQKAMQKAVDAGFDDQ